MKVKEIVGKLRLIGTEVEIKECDYLNRTVNKCINRWRERLKDDDPGMETFG